jgi:N-acylneuraminate cytidylyltransferase
MFGGHPLLTYSIAAGLQAQSVGRVIVSTDDEEIASIGREYGAEVPFLRPAELAGDETPDFPVFEHLLRELEAIEGYSPGLIVQLRPTSPLRPPDCIDRAVTMMASEPSVDSVRGVVPAGQNPYKMWRLDDDGLMSPLLESDLEEPFNQPRQILPATYWQTGHIDVVHRDTVLEKGSMTGDRVRGLVLDPVYAVDIDNEQDWRMAEQTLRDIRLPIVQPERAQRRFPERVELLVLDFDGTLTDDRVWVNSEGDEMVAAHRGDGLGLSILQQQGVNIQIVSKETHPVVAARASKLNIPVIQGAEDKATIVEGLLAEKGVKKERVVYLGNDVNDLPCFPLVGYAVAVADAHPSVINQADLVLSRPGGRGAVRELCDLILAKMEKI